MSPLIHRLPFLASGPGARPIGSALSFFFLASYPAYIPIHDRHLTTYIMTDSWGFSFFLTLEPNSIRQFSALSRYIISVYARESLLMGRAALDDLERMGGVFTTFRAQLVWSLGLGLIFGLFLILGIAGNARADGFVYLRSRKEGETMIGKGGSWTDHGSWLGTLCRAKWGEGLAGYGSGVLWCLE